MAVEDCKLVKKYQVRINNTRHVNVSRGKNRAYVYCHVLLCLFCCVCGIHSSCIYAVGCFSILPSSVRLDTISCMNKYSTNDGHALCYNNE